ncbi:MAG: hypothetical protein LBU27_08280, partial [Candidatus Peribacteria bacterium]|nr:hypothetical protein [Candidatus Peribacteria bacterium]
MCIGALDQIDEPTDTPTTTPTLPNADDVDPDEYQDYVEEVIDQIDSYLDPATGNNLPTGNVVGDTGNIKFDDENDVAKALEKVKTCFSSCEGLAYDKMLACKAMC